MNTLRRITRKIKVGSTFIGGDAPILVQTMAATKTRDVDATVATVRKLAAHGAGMIRIAVDAPIDAEALVEIRKRIDANLSVDLQENFRMAEKESNTLRQLLLMSRMRNASRNGAGRMTTF